MSGGDFDDFYFSPIFGVYRKLTPTDKIDDILKNLLKINKAVLEKTLPLILSVYPQKMIVSFFGPQKSKFREKSRTENRVDFVKKCQ